MTTQRKENNGPQVAGALANPVPLILLVQYSSTTIRAAERGGLVGDMYSISVPMSPGKDEEVCSSSLFSKMLDSAAGSH